MSAGHLSRQFKAAYGESPYSYLMTRRIERAMALLRRGDLSVTEVCFAVGCQSLGTFSTRFTELVGVPPSVYREREAAATRTAVSAKRRQCGHRNRSTRPIGQESRSPVAGAATSVSAMDITIHTSFLPHTDPDAVAGVLPRHPRLRGPHGRGLRGHALDHRRPAGPARHRDRAAPAGRRARPHRGRGADAARADGQGQLLRRSTWPPTTSTRPSPSSRPAAPRSSRSRPTSRTACATAPSATRPATCSASRAAEPPTAVERETE